MAVATDTSGQTQEAQAMAGTTSQLYLADLKKKLQIAKDARERYVPDFTLNLAFYLGGSGQWSYWNRSGRLDMPLLRDDREQLTDNRIMPVVSGRAARKVKSRPIFVATPFTADEEDVDASQIAEKVLDADWNALGLQMKLYQAILFAEICGAGFWKVYWDATKGPSQNFIYDGAGEPVMTSDGTPMRADMLQQMPADGLSSRSVAIGDVQVDVLSPFEFYPDPIATSMDELEWCIEEKVRSVEYVQRRFGVKLEPDAEAPLGPVDARTFGSLVYGAQGGKKVGVRVYEFWAKPSTEYPEGKRCVWARDQVLVEDDHPFDPLPYVMFSGVRSPNRFWPSAIVTQLRSPQVALNKLISQIQENANRIGNPALMKSRQANVHYTGRPGEEILYDSTVQDAVPSYLQPPEVPSYLREHVQRILDSVAEIAGLHEVSNATVPTGVTAASAINLLQEADDTRLGPEIQDMEHTIAQAGTKVLQNRAAYNTDQRLIRIAGEDENWDIFSFRGAMLRSNTDVEVQAGSAMPRSKAAKQAAMLEVIQTAFQYGVQFDQRDLRQFFRDYEVAALEKLFGSMTENETQVQREHRIMSHGVPLNINDWDDDSYHVEAHNSYRKSDAFTRLGPAVQGMFGVHVRAHQERLVQKQNLAVTAQAQDAAVAASGFGGAGGGPNPFGPDVVTPEGGLGKTRLP